MTARLSRTLRSPRRAGRPTRRRCAPGAPVTAVSSLSRRARRTSWGRAASWRWSWAPTPRASPPSARPCVGTRGRTAPPSQWTTTARGAPLWTGTRRYLSYEIFITLNAIFRTSFKTFILTFHNVYFERRKLQHYQHLNIEISGRHVGHVENFKSFHFWRSKLWDDLECANILFWKKLILVSRVMTVSSCFTFLKNKPRGLSMKRSLVYSWDDNHLWFEHFFCHLNWVCWD